jgi:Ca2+-binding EF-hand superfamily protein
MSLALRALLIWNVLTSIYGQEGADEADYDDQDIEEDSLTADQLRRIHAKFDGNGDGRVSLHEVMSFSDSVSKAIAGKDIGAILEEIDTSKDGKLSLEEHLSDIHNQADGGDEQEMQELEHRKAVEAAKFRAADSNSDGHLDANELPGLFYPETHEGVLDVTVAETMRQKDTNKDGKLNAKEFWESDQMDGDDADLSEEEKADFARLDTNGDGSVDVQELRAWESGRFHTEDAMKKLFEIADKDGDLHITGDELAEARDGISASDAQYHLIEWAEHHEL